VKGSGGDVVVGVVLKNTDMTLLLREGGAL